jgi:pyruvate dehydrogenase (quinone)
MRTHDTVGDFMLERLTAWGIRRVFGYPGDGINGLMGAMGRAADRFDYVRVRHEEMAAFMACAHAKFTGQVGVCLATSGPGAIHLLNGLYDAKLDHMPVMAIVGQQARSALGSDYQQEVDLQALFKDVAAYVQTVSTPAQVRHVLDRAIRIAQAERTVTCVIVPHDLQLMPAVPSPPREHGSVYSGVGLALPHPQPTAMELERAASVLNAGSKVAILIGAGALGAGTEVRQLAERLDAGVAKALLGKAALPDDLPYVTGPIGLLGSKPSWRLMNECDTLLMIGTTFPYSEFLPPDGQARAVQIDIAPRNMSLRYPSDVNLVGDAAEVIRRLLPLLREKRNPDWRERIELDVRKWWRLLEGRAMADASPVNPQRVFWELSAHLPDDAIICGDCGSHTGWFARDVKLREGMMASLSGGLATMGGGVPYAIAAKMAWPERPVLAIVGDGAMQMNGNAELITVKQYWRRWRDPRFVVLVVSNHDLNQVTWEQRVLAGDPKFDAAQDVEPFPYARYGELLGFRGIRVDRPEQIADAWRDAFAADGPVVIEAMTDPNVPPLPPHVKWEQARAYFAALAGPDTDRDAVATQTARQVLAGLFGAEDDHDSQR